MLKIFYELKPFLEDAYQEYAVRAYARILKITPPTSSKLLKGFEKEGILLSDKKGVYHYYRSNRLHYLYQGLCRLYWQDRLYHLTETLHEQVLYKPITLFGSILKCEHTKDSDVDLFVDLPFRKLDLDPLQRKLKRKIEVHFDQSHSNSHLIKNIKEGVIIR